MLSTIEQKIANLFVFVFVFVFIFIFVFVFDFAGEQHQLLDSDQPHQHLLRPRHHPLHTPHEGIKVLFGYLLSLLAT